MLTHLTVGLNRAAQGHLPLNTSTRWFSALPAEEKTAALHSLVVFIQQTNTKPSPENLTDVQTALVGHDILVCVTQQNLHHALGHLITNAADCRTFRLLLTMFGALDRVGRDTRCANNCSHWWHHLHEHPGITSTTEYDEFNATIISSPHDRRALIYQSRQPSVSNPWLVRAEITSWHQKPEACTWFGGRTLYTHRQSSRHGAIMLAQQWISYGIYPSGPEDHPYRGHHFQPHQPGVYIGQCERCHACGYDCAQKRCALYEAVPVVHTQRSGFLVCREHLEDDVPIDFHTAKILTSLR